MTFRFIKFLENDGLKIGLHSFLTCTPTNGIDEDVIHLQLSAHFLIFKKLSRLIHYECVDDIKLSLLFNQSIN